MDDGEPQPGPALLGGEEGIEDTGEIVALDPCSGIGDCEERLLACPA